MDGVLVDSTAAHYEAWRRIGEKEGIPYPRDLFDRTYGMHNRQTIPQWLGRSVSEEESERLANEKESLYRELAVSRLKPIPGVVRLVQQLIGAGYRLAVGSSGPKANVLLALQILGLESSFGVHISGDDVTEGKPHPEIFLKAARALNLPPRDCLVIEDAPPGIQAAHSAGMAVVAINSSRPASLLSEADLVISDFAQLTISQIDSLREKKLAS